MARKFTGFEGEDNKKIEADKALDEVQKKVREHQQKLPIELFNMLDSYLRRDGKLEVETTYGRNKDLCDAKNTQGQQAVSYAPPEGSRSHRFFLCEKAFKAESGNKPRLKAILLHELIHICGGEELDAEAYENLLFENDGASPPTLNDLARFLRDGFDGKWVKGTWLKMDPETGEIREIATDQVVSRFDCRWKGASITYEQLKAFLQHLGTTLEVRFENGGGN